MTGAAHAALSEALAAERVPILAVLYRLCTDMEMAEEALQEAAARALETWPVSGIPHKPAAWLTTVGKRCVIDDLRRRGRELPEAEMPEPANEVASRRDQLQLLFACCALELPERTRVCLALRSLVGLTTQEIARAWLEKTSATAQRLVRANRTLRAMGSAPWPDGERRAEAIDAVLRTIYLLFNEGYLASAGDDVVRPDIVHRALGLADRCVLVLPFHGETHGLAAMLWFHHARSDARTDAQGDLVLLADQPRETWDRDSIQRGSELLARAMELRVSGQEAGPYLLQAAIAALHCEAPSAEATDWLQIAALYRRLVEVAPSPVFELNAAYALAMSGDIAGGLAWLNALERRGKLQTYHLFAAAKAELLERAGHRSQARRYLGRARRLAKNDAERRLLARRIQVLGTDGD